MDILLGNVCDLCQIMTTYPDEQIIKRCFTERSCLSTTKFKQGLKIAMVDINGDNLQTAILKSDDENYLYLFKLMFRKLTEKDRQTFQITDRVQNL